MHSQQYTQKDWPGSETPLIQLGEVGATWEESDRTVDISGQWGKIPGQMDDQSLKVFRRSRDGLRVLWTVSTSQFTYKQLKQSLALV